MPTVQEAGAGLFREIAHPTDSQRDGEVAFAHALRLTLAARANLSVLYVSRKKRQEPWSGFPGVRELLTRWKVLPQGGVADDVGRLGIRVGKHEFQGTDPAGALATRLDTKPTDLVVLATHPRTGLDRWLQREIARPVARPSGAMTLFIPTGVAGFVSVDDGTVRVERVLLPVAHEPSPQRAVDALCSLLALLQIDRVSVLVIHVGQKETFPSLEVPPRPGWEWQREVTSGDVVGEIAAAAAEFRPSLLALATSGRQGILDMLRGSTTEQILGAVVCPVLAVPVNPTRD